MRWAILLLTLLFGAPGVSNGGIENFEVSLVTRLIGAHWDSANIDVGKDTVSVSWDTGSGDSTILYMSIFDFADVGSVGEAGWSGQGRHLMTFDTTYSDTSYNLAANLPEPGLLYISAITFLGDSINDVDTASFYMRDDVVGEGFPRIWSHLWGYEPALLDQDNWENVFAIDGFTGSYEWFHSTTDTNRQMARLLMDSLYDRGVYRTPHEYVQRLTFTNYGNKRRMNKVLGDYAIDCWMAGDVIYGIMGRTVLTVDLDASATTMTVEDPSDIEYVMDDLGYYPGYVVCCAFEGTEEIVWASAVSDNNVTVERGKLQTGGETHDSGDSVYVLQPLHPDEFNAYYSQSILWELGNDEMDYDLQGSGKSWPQYYAETIYSFFRDASQDSFLGKDGRPAFDAYYNDTWQSFKNTVDGYVDHIGSAAYDTFLSVIDQIDTTETFPCLANFQNEGEFYTPTTWKAFHGGSFMDESISKPANRFVGTRDILVEKYEYARLCKFHWFRHNDFYHPWMPEFIGTVNPDTTAAGEFAEDQSEYTQWARNELAMSCMMDGIHKKRHLCYGNPFLRNMGWYGELSVTHPNIISGITSGTAKRHWMGWPIEEAQILLDTATWNAADSVICDEDFNDGDLSNWEITTGDWTLDLILDAADDSALVVQNDGDSSHSNYSSVVVSCTLDTPEPDTIYTVSFYTMADTARAFSYLIKQGSTNIRSVGGSRNAQSGTMSGHYTRHVISFDTGSDVSGDWTLQFYVGKMWAQPGDNFYIDDVEIKKGNHWIGWKREYQRAFVVVSQDNDASHTVHLPDYCYKLLDNGSNWWSDEDHNSGGWLSDNQITVEPGEAWFLWKTTGGIVPSFPIATMKNWGSSTRVQRPWYYSEAEGSPPEPSDTTRVGLDGFMLPSQRTYAGGGGIVFGFNPYVFCVK